MGGYGHIKIPGKLMLRKGLSPLATAISTDAAGPVISGMRLLACKTGSGKSTGRIVAQAIATARATGVTGQILVRGDSAYDRGALFRVCWYHPFATNFETVVAAIDMAVYKLAANVEHPPSRTVAMGFAGPSRPSHAGCGKVVSCLMIHSGSGTVRTMLDDSGRVQDERHLARSLLANGCGSTLRASAASTRMRRGTQR